MSASRMIPSAQIVVLILVVGSLAMGVVYLKSRGGSDGTEETVIPDSEIQDTEDQEPQSEAPTEETGDPDTTVEETTGALNETEAIPVEEEPCGVSVESLTLSSEEVYLGETVEASV